MAKIKNLNAAGIDISSRDYYVAVPEDRVKDNVRVFGSFTVDIHDLANWLKQCRITTVAMESTGIYWYHLYTVLLEYGFEVYLVNAYHVKNVPGRKSDVNDAQWLQELHSFGLLNSCFQPDNLTRSLRNYVRQRKVIIKQMTTETQRMQKALQLMNIKLNNVIRDITGKTGMTIISKILEGERDPFILASYRDRRIKAPIGTIVKSLEANWQDEQLFNLHLAYQHYFFLEGQLSECDKQSEQVIKTMCNLENEKNQTKKGQKNQPAFDVKKYLTQVLGVDVTKIFGVSTTTALTIFSETGADLKEKFPTEKQFLSWLNVVPNNKITGGKIVYSKVKRKKNKAGQAFREAANGLWNAKNPLGDYLRGKKAKRGAGQAIVATARRIATIYYKMVTDKVEFDPNVMQLNKDKILQQKLKRLTSELKMYGLDNVDVANLVI